MQYQIVPTQDDALLAELWYAHWCAMGVQANAIAVDWREQMLGFLGRARAAQQLTGFVAQTEQTVLGGACCHIIDRIYPPFFAHDAPIIGYIWNMYVVESARGHGIGAALVSRCVQQLAERGCQRVLLHAGKQSQPLYHRLGFHPTDELALRVA